MSGEEARRLWQLLMGFRTSRIIYVAAKLEIADMLADGPRPVADLAEAADADPRALYRLLRALASLGIFVETEAQTFALTETAELLRTGEGTLRSTVLLYGDEIIWETYGEMLYSVKTGRSAFERIHGEPFYGYFAKHPEAAAVFQEAMTGFSNAEAAAIMAAYDFRPYGRIVDVGGGHGALVAALLAAHPGQRATILDLELAEGGARQRLGKATLTDRARFVVGDFFQSVPEDGDLYVLKSILHNWKDEAALKILGCCRAAMRREARLLLLERVVAPGNAASEAKLFDISMLVGVGGEERTAAEYEALLAAAGFALGRIIATEAPVSLIEAMPG